MTEGKRDLLDRKPWEAKEILFALDRMPRSLWPYEDVARVHLALSGTLLETLSSPDFQRRVYGAVDCGFAPLRPARARHRRRMSFRIARLRPDCRRPK